MEDILTKKFTAFIPNSEQGKKVKIFDTKVPFESPFSSTITLGLPKNIVWPVYVYTFSIPVTKINSNLNILERLILKVLTIRKYDSISKLSEIICIPEDLTNFIVKRLKEKNLLSDNYEAIKQTAEEENSIECCIFQEYFTGQIFPYIKKLDEDVFLASKNFHEENKREWSVSTKYPNKIQLTTNKVISIAKEMFDKYKSSFNTQEYSYEDFKNLGKKAIDLYPSDPQLFYLFSQIAIDIDSNKYFHIADPFGNGYSQILENAFEYNKDCNNWLSKQTQENKINQINILTNKEYINKNYKEVEKNITPERDRKYCTIDQLYSALEWALFYFCYYNKEHTKAIIELTNETNVDELLKNISQKIGFYIERKPSFKNIDKSKFEKIFERKNPVLIPLLEISLMLSSYDDEYFKRMNNLAKLEKNFIKRIFELHNDRGNQAHGSGDYYGNQDIELTDDKFCKNIIKTLLPDFKFNENDNIKKEDSRILKEINKQDEIDAFNIIKENFSDSYYKLNYNLQTILIEAEKYFIYYSKRCKSGEKCNVKKFAFLVSSICQNILFDLICKTPMNITNVLDCRLKFENKIKEAGFINQFEKTPIILSSVNDKYIMNSIRKQQDSTLGANLLVFLSLAEKDLLLNIKEKEKNFISIISKAIEYRGHGNKDKIISIEEFKKFREKIYKVIKILLGE